MSSTKQNYVIWWLKAPFLSRMEPKHSLICCRMICQHRLAVWPVSKFLSVLLLRPLAGLSAWTSKSNTRPMPVGFVIWWLKAPLLSRMEPK